MEAYMPKMALALSSFSAGLAFKLHRVHSQSQIIRSSPHRDVVLIEPRLSDLGDGPHFELGLREGAEAYKSHLCLFTRAMLGDIA